jgi:hypothetical protein
MRSGRVVVLGLSVVVGVGCGFRDSGLEPMIIVEDGARGGAGGGGAGGGLGGQGGMAGQGGTTPIGGAGGTTGGADARPAADARRDVGAGGATTVDAAVPVDMAPPPVDMAPPAMEAGPPDTTQNGGTPGKVACGASSCDTADEICCILSNGAAVCIDKGVNCGLGTVRRCDGPEDCTSSSGPGSGDDRVCCARAATVGGYRSACSTAAECATGAGSVICRTTGDCRDAKTCGATKFGDAVVNTCH